MRVLAAALCNEYGRSTEEPPCDGCLHDSAEQAAALRAHFASGVVRERVFDQATTTYRLTAYGDRSFAEEVYKAAFRLWSDDERAALAPTEQS